MKADENRSRREFLGVAAVGAAGAVLGCGSPQTAGGRAGDAGRDAGKSAADAGGARDAGGGDASSLLDATPECLETQDDIEGPFYLAGAPEKPDLVEGGMAGVRLTVSGRVLDRRCAPLPGAVLDIWQCDDAGAYDRAGYRLRGKVVAGADGRFTFRTVVPGHYLNGDQYRPAHIHVKAVVEERELLTTQLYFVGDPYNDIDPWFDPALALDWRREPGGDRSAAFDFVLATAAS